MHAYSLDIYHNCMNVKCHRNCIIVQVCMVSKCKKAVICKITTNVLIWFVYDFLRNS